MADMLLFPAERTSAAAHHTDALQSLAAPLAATPDAKAWDGSCETPSGASASASVTFDNAALSRVRRGLPHSASNSSGVSLNGSFIRKHEIELVKAHGGPSVRGLPKPAP
jgi:hypothetical protein